MVVSRSGRLLLQARINVQYVQTELPDKKALPASDARIFRSVAFCTDTEGAHESFAFLAKLRLQSIV